MTASRPVQLLRPACCRRCYHRRYHFAGLRIHRYARAWVPELMLRRWSEPHPGQPRQLQWPPDAAGS